MSATSGFASLCWIDASFALAKNVERLARVGVDTACVPNHTISPAKTTAEMPG
jgi:hypothetical protein